VKKINFIYQILFYCCLYGSCTEDPSISPLPKISNLKAEFETLEQVEDSLYASDTFLIPNKGAKDIFFQVSNKYDSVVWEIGDDNRYFHEDKFYLRFSQLSKEIIDIKLKVYDLDQRTNMITDSVSSSKSIYLISEDDNDYLFEGTFLGHVESSPSSQFKVTIVDFGPFQLDSKQFWLHVHNLPKGCGANKEISEENLLPTIKDASYRHFYVQDIGNTITNCKEIFGYGKMVSQDTIKIYYQYRDFDSFDYNKDIFIGIRTD